MTPAFPDMRLDRGKSSSSSGDRSLSTGAEITELTSSARKTTMILEINIVEEDCKGRHFNTELGYQPSGPWTYGAEGKYRCLIHEG